jgi:hypothetical protein
MDSSENTLRASFGALRMAGRRPAIGGLVLASVALMCGTTAAQSGPCTARIAEVERQVAQLQAAPPPSGAGEPTAPQSIGAQLHHQPTPGSVGSAENTANADADAALERARKADAAGDAAACNAALNQARRLYGL